MAGEREPAQPKRSARRTRSGLRRSPTRSSSVEVVDAILGAAGLLLDRDGLDGLTTNAMARVAGVSVGSLYHYFPDKAAIVSEMARRVEMCPIELAANEIALAPTLSAR